MTKMRKAIFSIVILIFVSLFLSNCTDYNSPPLPYTPTKSPTPLVESTPSEYASIDLNVKGVTIGTTHSQALKILGKPSRSRKIKVDNCGEETVLRVEYPGLEIEFGWFDTENEYAAQSFEVTGTKWQINENLRWGMTVDEVVSRLGRPWNESYDSSTKTLGYTAPDNNVGTLYFKNGKLWKAHWYIDPC